MNEINKYYALTKNEKEAEIYIYGDITSWPWIESDVSAYKLSSQIAELGDVDTIKVYINSYGGEVAEGLAIYNALKRHKAQIITVCDGFACSIASVIFAAGNVRRMSSASLLMIHNAWVRTSGNASQLRKEADDLDTITQASVNAYKAASSISEDEIKALMDAESWISPADAIEYGFATEIVEEADVNISQSARNKVFMTLTGDKKQPETPQKRQPQGHKEHKNNYLKKFFEAFKEE